MSKYSMIRMHDQITYTAKTTNKKKNIKYNEMIT